jgi:hypothetical protein
MEEHYGCLCLNQGRRNELKRREKCADKRVGAGTQALNAATQCSFHPGDASRQIVHR